MRLAFLTHEPFYPPSGGGSAEAIYLVEELVQRGHEIDLFCPRVMDPETVCRQFHVQLREFKTWKMGRYASFRNLKYLLYPSFLARMVQAAARERSFDLILSQHAIAAVAAGWLRQRLRRPTVMNFLDYLTGFMEAWPAYLAPPPLLRILTRFELSIPRRYGAEGVMTVSDTLADYFMESGVEKNKVQPIYYGFDAGLFPFQDRAAAGAVPGHPVVAMHGSLDHHHLREIAYQAIRHVVQKRPEVRFRFVGQRTSALTSFLKRIESLLPARQIETTGFVPYSKVAEHLRDATVGMVPYEESKGTHCAFVAKIVECLALGLPVVSTPLNSARRYFGKEPMVRFSGFDGESFGGQILGLLEEKPQERASEARAASERVRRDLDWRVISRKAVDFVERVYQTSKNDQR